MGAAEEGWAAVAAGVGAAVTAPGGMGAEAAGRAAPAGRSCSRS